jgi:hypothetical protein
MILPSSSTSPEHTLHIRSFNLKFVCGNLGKIFRYTFLKKVVLHELYRGKSEMTTTYFQLRLLEIIYLILLVLLMELKIIRN